MLRMHQLRLLILDYGLGHIVSEYCVLFSTPNIVSAISYRYSAVSSVTDTYTVHNYLEICLWALGLGLA